MGTSQSGNDTKQKFSSSLNDNPHFSQYVEQICNEVHNKIVTKSAFETIMEKLRIFKIIQLARTPLGDNLFQVLCKQYGGKLTSGQLYQFIVDLEKNVEKRCEYTFAAFSCQLGDSKYYNGNNNTVDERSFVTLVVESWKQGFVLLIQTLPEALRESDGDLIESWSQNDQQIKKIKSSAAAVFKNLDTIGNGKLDYYKFKAWILSKQQDKIEAKYGGYEVVVPLTLLKFTN